MFIVTIISWGAKGGTRDVEIRLQFDMRPDVLFWMLQVEIMALLADTGYSPAGARATVTAMSDLTHEGINTTQNSPANCDHSDNILMGMIHVISLSLYDNSMFICWSHILSLSSSDKTLKSCHYPEDVCSVTDTQTPY